MTHPGLERLRPRAGCRESAAASKSLSSFFCASYSVFDSRASATKGSRAASSRELHAVLASAMVIVPSTLLQYAVHEVKGAVGRTGGGGEASAASMRVTTSASCRRKVRRTAVVVARRVTCMRPTCRLGGQFASSEPSRGQIQARAAATVLNVGYLGRSKQPPAATVRWIARYGGGSAKWGSSMIRRGFFGRTPRKSHFRQFIDLFFKCKFTTS